MSQPLFVVDAFAERPFTGNPAAVCLLSEQRDDPWMQAVAAEMNLSETAFVQPRGDDFHLRWFTPKSEVKLCGHATLAAAHVLWREKRVSQESPITFHTLSGPLIARQCDERIEMDFPAVDVKETDAPTELAEALCTSWKWLGRNEMDLLVELDSEQALRRVAPDFAKLANVKIRGVIVTAPSDDAGLDFVSRFFAPAFGVNEDPVTGSAHCALGPFWHKRWGKSEMIGYQASERGGVVGVKVADDRVQLSGRAVTVTKGTLEV